MYCYKLVAPQYGYSIERNLIHECQFSDEEFEALVLSCIMEPLCDELTLLKEQMVYDPHISWEFILTDVADALCASHGFQPLIWTGVYSATGNIALVGKQHIPIEEKYFPDDSSNTTAYRLREFVQNQLKTSQKAEVDSDVFLDTHRNTIVLLPYKQ